VRWLAGQLGDDFWNALTTLINVEYVVFKNEETQAKFAAAQLSLHQIAIQDGVDSAEYKAQRVQNQQAFAAHVRSLLVPAA